MEKNIGTTANKKRFLNDYFCPKFMLKILRLFIKTTNKIPKKMTYRNFFKDWREGVFLRQFKK